MTTAVSVYIVESFVYRCGMVVSNIIGFSSVHLERHLLTFPGTVASNSPPIAPRQVIRKTESGKSFIAKFGILAFGIRSKAQGIRNPSSIEKNQESSSWNPESTAWNLESKNFLDYLTSCLRNQRSFGDDINGFPAKRRLRNERRNSIVMTRHYPDLGGASDWLNQIFTRHDQSEALLRSGQWRVISMEFLRSLLRLPLEGKLVVASPNVGCCLRLPNMRRLTVLFLSLFFFFSFYHYRY